MTEEKKSSIYVCEHTGLLYIEEVPFTLDHLKKIRKVFKYQKKCSNGQFKHEVTVTDTATGCKTVIDDLLVDDIFRLMNLKDIARDKEFEM